MRRLSCLAMVAVLCSFLALPGVARAAQKAVATTYSLEAASLAPWEWTDFSVAWTDVNHDGLLQLDEVETSGFSGVTYLPFVWFYETLDSVPLRSVQSLYTGGEAQEWVFGGAMGPWGADPSAWSYNREVLSAVPVPASAFLLGSGLLGLGLLAGGEKKFRRKNRRDRVVAGLFSLRKVM